MSLRETIFMNYPEKKQEYVTFVIPFDEPVNLYLNIEQLINSSHRFVYFFTSTYGKSKVILWGVYDKKRDIFSFDGSCRYRIQQLNNIINTWEKNKFVFIADYVRNRMVETLGSLFGQNAHITERQYHQYKYILSYYERKISKEQLEEFYPSALNDLERKIQEKYALTNLINDLQFDSLLEDELDLIRLDVRNYEEFINRIDIPQHISLSRISDRIMNIVNKFYEDIKTGKYLYSSVPCPDESSCQEYCPACGVYYYGIHPDYLNKDDLNIT